MAMSGISLSCLRPVKLHHGDVAVSAEGWLRLIEEIFTQVFMYGTIGSFLKQGVL